VDILHPVVVVDAQIWRLHRATLKSIPLCRFYQPLLKAL
jgi:hypothetical protein